MSRHRTRATLLTAAAVMVAALVGGGLRYASADRTDAGSSSAANSGADPSVDGSADDGPAATGAGELEAPATGETADQAGDGATPEAAIAAARADCLALDEELGRREELDLIDWDQLDGRLDVAAVDEDSIELTLPPADGRVAPPGERPTIARFADRYDPTEVSVDDLLEGIWRCEDAGLLVDPDDDPDL